MISPQLILGAYPRPAYLLSPSELPFVPLHCLLLNIPARPAALQRTHGGADPAKDPNQNARTVAWNRLAKSSNAGRQ